jgi:hypothetical protein
MPECSKYQQEANVLPAVEATNQRLPLQPVEQPLAAYLSCRIVRIRTVSFVEWAFPAIYIRLILVR